MFFQKSQLFALLVLIHYAKLEETSPTTAAATETLQAEEAKGGGLDIIKTIKKVNDDGSYTIGYEADDGSFKIESRDVLGNVKGTYGYVDEDGEIKRVSYSTSNTSDLLADVPTVVQRIPKLNKTLETTRKPSFLLYNPTTTQPTTVTSVIQPIPKRNAPTIEPDSVRSTTRSPNVVYITTPPRGLYSQRHGYRPNFDQSKSEGQLVRPDTTKLPLIRRLATKASTTKPVVEEPESDLPANLVRRQLPDKYDARQQVLMLQQGMGSDATDVYTASVTTGAPPPLFTTTRPTLLPSSASIVTERVPVYQLNPIPKGSEYAQETTTETAFTNPTPTTSPVFQIPASREGAVSHPFHRGIVLLPYNQQQPQQIRNSLAPQYFIAPTPNPEVSPNGAPIFIPRPPVINQPVLRSIPVQVDENGYIRPVQIARPTTPQPIAIPVTQAEAQLQDDIERIKPPVSTRDFQRLLEHLILRQSKLERVNTLIQTQRQQEQANRYRFAQPVYVSGPPVQYIQEASSQKASGFLQRYTTPATSYAPTKRMARLYNPQDDEEAEDVDSEYLPPQVREMLLLRMLQLAINPALPMDDEEPTASPSQLRKGVRNVEILGEENEGQARRTRSKRYKDNYGSYQK